MYRLALILFICTFCPAAEQEFAYIGDLALERGGVIKNCRVGYRTYGVLNADKSNAILWPTWFGGTSGQLEDMIGPGRLADSSHYFVITADALGNGVSSSPSNSQSQQDAGFPRFTIGDMVRAHHRLVTEKLGLKQLYAVMGISMGGMQTFEWMVAYPEFMTKAVPIVGTTSQTSMDLMLWGAQLGIIEAAQNCNCNRTEAMRNVGMIHSFALDTPQYRVRETPPQEFDDEILRDVKA
jgi:homoserine O-acetyltransferase